MCDCVHGCCLQYVFWIFTPQNVGNDQLWPAHVSNWCLKARAKALTGLSQVSSCSSIKNIATEYVPKKTVIFWMFFYSKGCLSFCLSTQDAASMCQWSMKHTWDFGAGCRYRIFESSNAASCLSGAWNHGWHRSCDKVQPSSCEI